MKKLLLATFATMAMISLHAQTDQTDQVDPAAIKESITEFLKVEGYVPDIDEDGDIHLKASGTNYYIRVYDALDSGFCYVELYCIYTVDDATLEKVAAAVNATIPVFKMVRASYSKDDEAEGRFRVLFETPCYVADADSFNRLFVEYVDCIDESSDRFYAIMNEKE